MFHAKINYIESNDNETTVKQLQENSDIDEVASINQVEGIASEQIIIQISEEGFVSSHGNHYHYYNVAVPYDAVFGEKTLVPAEYQLNDADIVYEIEHGFVVKVDDKFKLYFKISKPSRRFVQMMK
ncbi:pneumococcal-type histidine triad protein [Globicatella sulfidifaciens]|uniref:pneumococcal-type histidine triad protein n=1 Tax=Globicatella sulfidifaciens TaxID=136093 RepID=UPI00389904DD